MTFSIDNTVKIWSLEPHEDGIATFDLIATLSEHQQAVNCVRWAGHGRLVLQCATLNKCLKH
jgi:WD40 repeat protein